VVYLDSAGEPPFIRRVFEEFGPRAEHTGAVLLTAFGYDDVPGNVAGALALQATGPAAARVRVGYFVRGNIRKATSAGTRPSAAGVLLEPGYSFRGGRLVTERAAAPLGRLTGVLGALDQQARRIQSSRAAPGAGETIRSDVVAVAADARGSRLATVHLTGGIRTRSPRLSSPWPRAGRPRKACGPPARSARRKPRRSLIGNSTNSRSRGPGGSAPWPACS
jgi:hypothetical protein